MKINTREMIIVSLFCALMTIGAYLKIPFPIVPITLQPFFCAFAGILLGSRLGFLSQIVYIIMGLIGLPVFTSGGGITYIFKPSFGYILGFAFGAYVIGFISERIKKQNPLKRLATLTAGLIVMYAFGIPYTFIIMKFYLKSPEAAIVWSSIIPFIIKDFILFIIIAGSANKVTPILRKFLR